jgi:hypothetical protein
LKRIDGKMPKIPVKLSVAFDTRKKKFCAAKIRVLPAHDIRDAKFLLSHSNPKIAVADKAYNAEKLFKFANENNIKLMVPEKSNAKRGFYRKKAKKKFRLKTYHRRELVESGNSSIKRKMGSSVSSRSVRTIRTDVYGRLACHNIFFWLFKTLGTEPRMFTVRRVLGPNQVLLEKYEKKILSNDYCLTSSVFIAFHSVSNICFSADAKNCVLTHTPESYVGCTSASSSSMNVICLPSIMQNLALMLSVCLISATLFSSLTAFSASLVSGAAMRILTFLS